MDHLPKWAPLKLPEIMRHPDETDNDFRTRVMIFYGIDENYLILSGEELDKYAGRYKLLRSHGETDQDFRERLRILKASHPNAAPDAESSDSDNQMNYGADGSGGW